MTEQDLMPTYEHTPRHEGTRFDDEEVRLDFQQARKGLRTEEEVMNDPNTPRVNPYDSEFSVLKSETELPSQVTHSRMVGGNLKDFRDYELAA